MYYGVFPPVLRLLQNYWYRLSMMERYVGYFGGPFKVRRGVNQGFPISSIIFNVVVDVVIRHWISVVVDTEGVEGGVSTLGIR